MASTEKKNKKDKSFEQFAPVLMVVVVLLSFLVGSLWQKVKYLENGGQPTTTNRQAAGNNPTNVQGAANQPSQPTSGKLSEDRASNLPRVTDSDHVRGSRDAEVFLIEYSDYQCPYCARFHPTAQQLIEEYGDRVAWVYRHFPLDMIHPQARPAAETAECIASIGGNDAFWIFTDSVFEALATNQPISDLSTFIADSGVNAQAVESCVNEGQFADLVEQNYQDGIKAGVTGTPGNFILNSEGEVWLLPGAVPYAALESTIEEALGN